MYDRYFSCKVVNLTDIRNTQVALKLEDMILNLDASLRPLKPDYVVPLSRDLASVTFSRPFFSKEYGGGSVATWPKIADEKVERHGIYPVMFITTDYNPNAPVIPGKSGTFFGGGYLNKDGEWEDVMYVFVKIDDNRWRFVGLYEFTRAPPMTKEEWIDQDTKVNIMSYYALM